MMASRRNGLNDKVFDFVVLNPACTTKDVAFALDLTDAAAISQLGRLFSNKKISRRPCKRQSNRGVKTYFRFTVMENGKSTDKVEYRYPVFAKIPHKIPSLFSV